MNERKMQFTIKNVSFYIIGVLTIGFGVHILLSSQLGAGAWDTPSSNGKAFFNLLVGWEWVTLGMLSALINTIILLMVILYRKKVKYLITLIPILLMGSVLDLWSVLVFENVHINHIGYRVVFYLLGTLTLPFGLALVVKSSFPAFVFEEWTFMLQEITKWSFRKVRITIELAGATLGTLFALMTYFTVNHELIRVYYNYPADSTIVIFGSVGLGTFILAIAIGPLVQYYLKVLKVQTNDA